MHYQTDVIILGAGPIGIFSVFELGMLNIKAHVVEALDFIGGQCSALYPEKPIYDIPAYPQIAANDLILRLREQAEVFKPMYHLAQTVEKLTVTADEVVITTSKNVTISAKAIIIAAGCGAFGPNRPPLANIEEFEGSGGVCYLVRSVEDFRGKKVVIAGGGDSAIDWALSLAKITKKLYLVHRRNKFKCAPHSLAQLEELAAMGKIELVVPYQLSSLNGTNNILEQVVVEDLDGKKKALEADVLLPFFGLSMELGPIVNWGLNLHKNYIQVEQSSMATNLARVFAAGDIAHYHAKLKLILTGFAEAASAAHAIYPLIHSEALHFEYSTTKGIA
jgi:thioredoxin reductase (NADPH)